MISQSYPEYNYITDLLYRIRKYFLIENSKNSINGKNLDDYDGQYTMWG